MYVYIDVLNDPYDLIWGTGPCLITATWRCRIDAPIDWKDRDSVRSRKLGKARVCRDNIRNVYCVIKHPLSMHDDEIWRNISSIHI